MAVRKKRTKIQRKTNEYGKFCCSKNLRKLLLLLTDVAVKRCNNLRLCQSTALGKIGYCDAFEILIDKKGFKVQIFTSAGLLHKIW